MVSCSKILTVVAGASVVIGGSLTTSVQAASPETAPTELVEAIAAIEAAANAQDLAQLMALYSPDFAGPDGFTRDQYEATLQDFWAQHTDLSYDVELLSWEQEGTALIAETLTTVEGTRMMAGRAMTLSAMVRSQQRYENGQLAAQAILSEENQLISGVTPPDITVQLPETVAPGERFAYDAIVSEPLGNRLLLGLAFDEGVTAEDFLTPRPANLEALAAGGLFKVGTAPGKPDQRWVSAVIVREGGIVIDTRRLNVQTD